MQLNVAAKTDHSVAEQRETCQDGSLSICSPGISKGIQVQNSHWQNLRLSSEISKSPDDR